MVPRVRTSIVLTLVLLAGCSSPTTPTPRAADPVRPPELSITCPANVTATSPEGVPATVTFPPPTTTGGVAPIEVACTRQSGSPFAAGATEVQCTATDASSQRVSCVFSVMINATTPQLTRTKFLAFGDSLTMGEITIPNDPSVRPGSEGRSYTLGVVPGSSYPTKLAEMLKGRYRTQGPSIVVTNAGWSGEWAQDGAKRLVQVLSSSRPEVVILLEGVNDIATLLDRGIAPAAAAVASMIRESKGRGAEVLVATLPPSRPGGDHAVATSLLTQYNDRLRQVAAAEGATLVDLYNPLLANVAAYIGVDGLHPNEEGYARMAELFAQAIREKFEARPATTTRIR
jgi:acyl-CoA thioesterase-1